VKITGLTLTPVNVPLEAPIRWPWGVRAETTRMIVELSTDEGLTGLGETMGGNYLPVILKGMEAKLKGENPFDIERILSKFQMTPYFTGYAGRAAIGAVEMACWDIMGKAVGKPLHQLIGGKYRDTVEFAAYVFARYERGGRGGENSPEALVEYCRQVQKRDGFRVFKYKGGVHPPSFDVETIRLMREAFGPDTRLRIDPNALWTFETALQTCKRLEPYALEFIEDPVWGIDAMARLRRDISTPLSTNMCVVSFEDLPLGIQNHAVDVILGDPHKWGGILATKKLAAVCETFSIGMSMHSGAELGISTAVNVHLAASTPQIYLAIDTHYDQTEDDVIAGGKLRFENGSIRVPDAPGIGVELDRDKLKEYSESYAKGGTSEHAGEDAERPNWIPRRPMW
jgi:glucarate dehydratase